MADKAALRILGFTYGGITAAVMLIAAFVVVGNIGGDVAADGVTAVSSANIIR